MSLSGGDTSCLSAGNTSVRAWTVWDSAADCDNKVRQSAAKMVFAAHVILVVMGAPPSQPVDDKPHFSWKNTKREGELSHPIFETIFPAAPTQANISLLSSSNHFCRISEILIGSDIHAAITANRGNHYRNDRCNLTAVTVATAAIIRLDSCPRPRYGALAYVEPPCQVCRRRAVDKSFHALFMRREPRRSPHLDAARRGKRPSVAVRRRINSLRIRWCYRGQLAPVPLSVSAPEFSAPSTGEGSLPPNPIAVASTTSLHIRADGR
jgi:hypothetical protein